MNLEEFNNPVSCEFYVHLGINLLVAVIRPIWELGEKGIRTR